MRLPVPTSIERQWEVLDLVTVNVIAQSEDGAEACLCKDRMGSLKLNMIVRDISNGSRKSIRHQGFFDGEMRKLHDSRIVQFSHFSVQQFLMAKIGRGHV